MPPTSASTLLNRFTIKAKFRHMQVLVKLAELGSMRRVAQAVNMTQPAVSQLVAEMERLLETELFFRHARGVEPTETARDLLPVARRILEALQDGSEAVANRLLEQGGIVRISASPAALGGLIHGTLHAFAEAHPDIQVHISGADGNEALGGIIEASADIIFTREPPVIPKGWVFERCLDDRLIVACGNRHHLANRTKLVSRRELGQCRWLLNRVGSVARNRFEESFEAGGWPQSSRCQIIAHIPALTKEMLSTGNYLAILPRSVALPWLGSGDIKELKTEMDAPLAPLGFLWRGERAGSATGVFAAHIRASSSSHMNRTGFAAGHLI